MSKIKGKSTSSLKMSADQAVLKPPEKPLLSFEHLTTNSNYNFDYFKKEKHNMMIAKNILLDRIIEISQNTWLHWQSLNKYQGGMESFDVKGLNIKPHDYIFSEDEKVIVFRATSNYRIIGFRDSTSPTYYIIGFDFDYSAYNHGL